jgi:transcriptional regulator with XRE-family HTH domain
MPSLDDDHTGARIREQRRLARLTQRQLAARIPYSYSLLNQVECGARPATADFVAAVARALNVDVTVLTGQPYVTELQRDRLAELVRPIRESLDLYDLGANPELRARPAAELVAEADHLCVQVRATHLRDAARALPGVITELTHTAWTTPSTELWQALASTYRTAHDISVKLGYYDLAAVALDRMDWAAQRASDPCLAAVRQYMRALVYFREGEYTIGRRLIASGHGIVGQTESNLESLAVTGQLHLGASVICARANDKAAVDLHLDEARRIAKRTGPDRPPTCTGCPSDPRTSPCTACPQQSRWAATTTL